MGAMFESNAVAFVAPTPSPGFAWVAMVDVGVGANRETCSLVVVVVDTARVARVVAVGLDIDQVDAPKIAGAIVDGLDRVDARGRARLADVGAFVGEVGERGVDDVDARAFVDLATLAVDIDGETFFVVSSMVADAIGDIDSVGGRRHPDPRIGRRRRQAPTPPTPAAAKFINAKLLMNWKLFIPHPKYFATFYLSGPACHVRIERIYYPENVRHAINATTEG